MRFSYVFLAALLVCGCSERAWWAPPSDPALRKPTREFKADAAKRHPYKSDAPRGGELASAAEVGYDLKQITVANLSDQDWTDLEIWVNHDYVVSLPKIEAHKLRTIYFSMLYDGNGKSFPRSKTMVNKVEILMGGKMHDVPVKIPD